MNSGYRGRVRTGCLTCRTSKVRCDEQHPICKRCERLQRVCVYKKKKTLQAPSTPTSTGDRNLLTDSPIGSVAQQVGSATQNAVQQAPDAIPSQSATPVSGQSLTSIGESPSLQSMMVSQDIYLCTTIDLLAANEVYRRPSFNYFKQTVESPFITPYDPVNWTIFKEEVLRLVTYSTHVAAATIAVQSLYKAQSNGLPLSGALSLYNAASNIFETVLSSEDNYEQFDLILTTAFLISLIEMLVPEETREGPFRQSESAFTRRIETWSLDRFAHSSLSLRLAAWLLISHAAARRGGNLGLLSPTIYNLLESTCSKYPHLPPLVAGPSELLSTSLLSTLTAPFFTFHFQLQLLSARVADHSHYHRSRITSADQEEVSLLLSSLKSQMHVLWESRPTAMRHSACDLRQLVAPAIADPLILSIAICASTYYTELVEIGRTLSDPPLISTEARSHLAQIRETLLSPEGPTSLSSSTCNGSSSIHPAFLRPLFLYAIESIHESETQWAVTQIRKIKDPICRSDFFANFAEGLAEAQRSKARRVTTKWWCWQAFGVTPPYL